MSEKRRVWILGLIGTVLSAYGALSNNYQMMVFGVICFVIVWCMYLYHIADTEIKSVDVKEESKKVFNMN